MSGRDAATEAQVRAARPDASSWVAADAGPGRGCHTISARIFFLSSLPTEVRGSSSTNTTRSGMP